ncbi:MAG: hypothetical protein ACT4TC_25210 [Myxococcaceae bacterium]
MDAGAPTAARATIVNKNGKVEVNRAKKGWREAQIGDPLSPDDAVRTSENGELEIGIAAVRIRVRERSEFRVKTLTNKVLRGQLKGQLESSAPEKGERVVEIEGENSDALVRSEGGTFSISADERGGVAVAAVNGVVDLSSAGRSVRVRAGEISRASRGSAPQAPKAARRTVLLAVDWPNRKETNRRTIPLAGHVDAGTRVLVQGKLAKVDDDGNFNAEIPLKRGRQRVGVVAVDVLGRRRVLDTHIFQDDALPNVQKENRLWQQ